MSTDRSARAHKKFATPEAQPGKKTRQAGRVERRHDEISIRVGAPESCLRLNPKSENIGMKPRSELQFGRPISTVGTASGPRCGIDRTFR